VIQIGVRHQKEKQKEVFCCTHHPLTLLALATHLIKLGIRHPRKKERKVIFLKRTRILGGIPFTIRSSRKKERKKAFQFPSSKNPCL